MLRQVQPGNGRDTMQAPNKLVNQYDRHLYLVGLGANLPSKLGPPLATLTAAMAALEARNIKIMARSPWFESEPVPASNQNWFVNAVICISSLEKANTILKILHDIEIQFGRTRSVPNAPRPIDLDFLAAIGGVVVAPRPSEVGGESEVDLTGDALVLPHPRIAIRRFVLEPLAAIAPEWAHPANGQTAAALAAALPQTPAVRLLRG
jgi:2-amino-4-hydroxy-6-hydroxymethyldihydropteridine diphosphokinase